MPKEASDTLTIAYTGVYDIFETQRMSETCGTEQAQRTKIGLLGGQKCNTYFLGGSENS